MMGMFVCPFEYFASKSDPTDFAYVLYGFTGGVLPEIYRPHSITLNFVLYNPSLSAF